MLLCHDKVIQHGENLCHDRLFFHHDRKSQDIRFPCHDIALYVMIVGVRRCVTNKAGCVRDRGSLSTTEPGAHDRHE